MSERIYTDVPGYEAEVTRQVDELTVLGQKEGGPFAVVAFERDEIVDDARPSREYVQPVLFTGDADEINAAIADFMGPDGDGDITTEAWLEAYRGIEPGDIEFGD
jgi:hypothetical protein